MKNEHEKQRENYDIKTIQSQNNQKDETNKNPWPTLLIAVVFISFMGFISWRYLHQARNANDEIMAEHIDRLKDIFKRINSCCTITSFRGNEIPINFLTVKSFEGSTVGSMNLADPKKWQGPYLKRNLNIQGISYQIIQAKQGYFIIPGEGVRLANGKIIGKTLKIDKKTDIKALMKDAKGLQSQDGRPLAARIKTAPGVLEEIETETAGVNT